MFFFFFTTSFVFLWMVCGCLSDGVRGLEGQFLMPGLSQPSETWKYLTALLESEKEINQTKQKSVWELTEQMIQQYCWRCISHTGSIAFYTSCLFLPAWTYGGDLFVVSLLSSVTPLNLLESTIYLTFVLTFTLSSPTWTWASGFKRGTSDFSFQAKMLKKGYHFGLHYIQYRCIYIYTVYVTVFHHTMNRHGVWHMSKDFTLVSYNMLQLLVHDWYTKTNSHWTKPC